MTRLKGLNEVQIKLYEHIGKKKLRRNFDVNSICKILTSSPEHFSCFLNLWRRSALRRFIKKKKHERALGTRMAKLHIEKFDENKHKGRRKYIMHHALLSTCSLRRALRTQITFHEWHLATYQLAITISTSVIFLYHMWYNITNITVVQIHITVIAINSSSLEFYAVSNCFYIPFYSIME